MLLPLEKPYGTFWRLPSAGVINRSVSTAPMVAQILVTHGLQTDTVEYNIKNHENIVCFT